MNRKPLIWLLSGLGARRLCCLDLRLQPRPIAVVHDHRNHHGGRIGGHDVEIQVGAQEQPPIVNGPDEARL